MPLREAISFALFFPERPAETVEQRPERIERDRAPTGLDHRLHRHAGQKRNVPEGSQLPVVDADRRCIIGLVSIGSGRPGRPKRR